MRAAKISKPCAYCGKAVLRVPSHFERGSKGPLAGLVFCSREHQRAKFRHRVECSWPGCSAEAETTGATHRRTRRRGSLCEEHYALLRARAGNTRKVTDGNVAFLGGGAIEHRRCTSKFVRAVVFDVADGECRGCGATLNFEDPSWHIDHLRPVYRGGETSLQNLQLLCLDCHAKKTSAEQADINRRRYAGKLSTARIHRRTHLELEALIAQLLRRIEELETGQDQEKPKHDPEAPDDRGGG